MVVFFYLGLPLHQLKLKIGCVLMLLRNLAPSIGLCNGVRMKLLSATNRLLTCQIITGDFQGQIVYIPKIGLIPKESSLACDIKRYQFPVRLAYAMTINKAQGQSLKRVGIDLSEPVFAHGQLYVAVSRASNPDGLYIHLPGDKTSLKNVVFGSLKLY